LPWLPSERFHFLRGDLAERGVLEAACDGSSRRGAPPVVAVVHLAAFSSFGAAEAAGRDAVWRTNVEAVRRAFESADRLAAGRFILASTSSVYGRTPLGVEAEEGIPVKPLSLYAESKVEAERTLEEAGRGARTGAVVFRFATAYGISPRMRFDLLLNQLVSQAFLRGEITLYHPEHSRSFAHVQDLAQGVIAGIEAPDDVVRGRVFNLAGKGGNCTKKELAELIQRALPSTRIVSSPGDSGGDIRDLRISGAAAREALGFAPRLGIPDGIAEIVGALRAGVFRDPESERYRNAAAVMA
jgi:nucleoside-diphosphate-sugar epimerase